MGPDHMGAVATTDVYDSLVSWLDSHYGGGGSSWRLFDILTHWDQVE
jgi:hypothetical protein